MFASTWPVPTEDWVHLDNSTLQTEVKPILGEADPGLGTMDVKYFAQGGSDCPVSLT